MLRIRRRVRQIGAVVSNRLVFVDALIPMPGTDFSRDQRRVFTVPPRAAADQRSCHPDQYQHECGYELSRPVPLYWVYVTAWATPDGVVQFRDDIYNRDGLGAVAQTQRG